MEVREQARACLAVGISIVSVRTDGTKQPTIPWKLYQRKRADLAEIHAWFRNGEGLAVIGGAVSGNLEVLDFDNLEIYEAFLETAQRSGLGDLVDRVRAGYEERSPKGAHLLWRCSQIAGNTKLARQIAQDDRGEPIRDEQGNVVINTLIETRGEGGYCIIAPSNGRVHPSGKPYVLLQGSISAIPTITPQERAALFQLARTFGEPITPSEPRAERCPEKTRSTGDRPGDLFNAQATWEEILKPHGWVEVFERAGVTYWRRPGKAQGVSATTNFAGSDLLYVFSTSTMFEAERGYSKFPAYAVLNHSGDFEAAARDLASRGYCRDEETSTKKQQQALEAARQVAVTLLAAARTNPLQAIQGALEKQPNQERPAVEDLALLATLDPSTCEALLLDLQGVGAKTRDVDALKRAVKAEQKKQRQEEKEARRARAEQARAKRDPISAALPEIDASNLDLPTVSAEAWAAIEQANDRDPFLFCFAGIPTRIDGDDENRPVTCPLTKDRMRYVLARVATWVLYGEEKHIVLPPMHVVSDLLADPKPPLPVLERIVETPVLAADGSVQLTAGYHAASRTYLVLQPGFSLPAVSDSPSPEEIHRAKALILEDLLGDFPFVSDADKAHAVTLFLSPFVRSMIHSPTPLHLIEKPSPGTGATLLVEVVTFPATGHPIGVMTEGSDDDEWRKRLTAMLKDSPPFVVIDNLRLPLDSAQVSAAITAPIWKDRLLGVSAMVSLRVRCAWIATANNPALSDEMSRRAVRTRMDAKMPEPWLRPPGEFRHPNLSQWVRENRSDLIWSALTLGRAWIAAGRPRGEKTLGMFEHWAEVMGGILDVAGIPGFLTNLDEFYKHSTEDRAKRLAFLAAWWDQYHDKEVGVSELFPIATTLDPPLGLGEEGERSQRTKLGKLLSTLRDRQFPLPSSENGKSRPREVRLVASNIVHQAQLWRLISVDPPRAEDNPPAGGERGERGEPFPAPPPAGKEKTPHTPPGVEPAPSPPEEAVRAVKKSSAYAEGTENVPQVPQVPPGAPDARAEGRAAPPWEDDI